MSVAPAIEATGLVKRYRRPERTIDVLAEVDLRVKAGEWVAMTGPSGCGKTTLLHLLGILDKPDAGTIAYFGKDVARMGPFRKARLRRLHIGFIFQSYQLLPELSALENVMLPARFGGVRNPDQAMALLERMGVAERQSHRPAEMSGGEQQRVAIARALINQPDVILADEPTGNLDAKNAAAIMEILQRLRDEDGKTIVMVTHDRELTSYADRVMVLNQGALRQA